MGRPVWVLLLLLFAVESGRALSHGDALQIVPEDNASPEQPKEDEFIGTVTCGSVPGSEIVPARLAEENAVKLALYEAAVSGKGVVKARQICHTIEGDPIPVSVTVKGGKVKVTHDYSRDRFGAGRFKFMPRFFTVRSYTTRKIQIGHFDDRMRFVALDGESPKDRRLFLKLKGKHYF